MLIQYSLTNYRNFKETATLDMSEAKITEFPNHLYSDSDGLRLIPMAALYGANGSGKSNFLKSFQTLRQLICDAPSIIRQPMHFFQNSPDTPIEYDILFRIGYREYDYQLKLTPGAVMEENLFGRNLSDAQFDVLFDRDSDGVFLWEAWEDVNVSDLSDQFPLLYYLGTRTQEQELQSILQYFQNIQFFTDDYTCLQKQEAALREILSLPAQRTELLSHLKNMDFDITDIQQQQGTLQIIHEVGSTSFALSWEEEGFGTCRLLGLLAVLMKARKEHTLLLVDLPEIGLHAKTLHYLYHFVSQNATAKSQSQVIFATQETSNMNHATFRRDELWMIHKNADGSSRLYTLALFPKENGEKVRKDEVYFKQYLEGRYGAVPDTHLS